MFYLRIAIGLVIACLTLAASSWIIRKVSVAAGASAGSLVVADSSSLVIAGSDYLQFDSTGDSLVMTDASSSLTMASGTSALTIE